MDEWLEGSRFYLSSNQMTCRCQIDNIANSFFESTSASLLYVQHMFNLLTFPTQSSVRNGTKDLPNAVWCQKWNERHSQPNPVSEMERKDYNDHEGRCHRGLQRFSEESWLRMISPTRTSKSESVMKEIQGGYL